MDAIEYLDSLIAGMDMGSSIPIQRSELAALKAMVIQDQMKLMARIIQDLGKPKD